MTIKILQKNNYNQYSNFLLENESNLFYTSVEYKAILEDYLGIEGQYILAKDNEDKIIGAFPVFLKQGKYGFVVNSLPFYGSNGGLIGSGLPQVVKNNLLDKYKEILSEKEILASCIIENPLYKEEHNLSSLLTYNLTDMRIGQITPLPAFVDEENLEMSLIAIFQDPRPRNIRKAKKSNVRVYLSDNSTDDWDFLFETHKQNIDAIGGLSKEKRFFNVVRSHIGDNPNICRLYIAEIEGKKVAALLTFFFNKTVEYFTPATLEEYRSQQPLSLIVFEAMKDAVRQGYKYWNWGGTWASQGGVYDYKKRWGTLDINYTYYINADIALVKNLSKSEILKEYQFFYVVPFNIFEVNNA